MAGHRSASGALMVTVLVVTSGGAGVVFADDAGALLKRGTADMKAGDYEKACPALAESYKLEPNPISAFQSATCEAQAGRFKTATVRYGQFLELVEALPARDRKQHSERIEIATKQRAELGPLVSTVTITLSAGAPADTIVKIDGAPIERGRLGAPLQVDPGERVFTTQAPSGPIREQRVTLSAGEPQAVTLVVDLPPGTAAPRSATTAEPEPDRAPSLSTEESSGLRRPLAYGALALGILGVATGAVTGILSIQKKNIVDGNCDGGTCTSGGKSAADAGLLLAHLSTIGFAVGVAGLGAGVVLILTEPADAPPPAKTSAALRGVSIGLAGRW